jgi:transcriptional regulator with XRE-family HTH domain
MSNVIERIINLRKHKGLTQKQVASHLNVTMLTYGKWERKETVMPLDKLEMLAKLFKVEPAFFFYENDKWEVETTGDYENFSIELTKKEKDAEIGILNNQIENLEHSIFWFLKRVAKRLIDKKLFKLHETMLFFYYLRSYINNIVIDTECFVWYKSFISLYNIETLKNLYPDFFILINKLYKDTGETTSDEDGVIDFDSMRLYKYVMKKAEDKDFIIYKMLKEWEAFYERKLFLESFRNYEVFSFLMENESTFEKLVSDNIYSTWLEYKNSTPKHLL